MFQNRVLKIFLAFIILLHSFRISTFAGQRKGLIAGYGLGIGVSYREAKNNWYTAHNARFNIANDLKLGFAPTNQVQIFFSLKIASLIEEPPKGIEGLFWLFLLPFNLIYKSHTFAGMGISYYLNPETPSLFFEGGFGDSFCYVKYDKDSWLSPSHNSVDSNGIYISIGYEFKKHISVMLNVMGLHALENNSYTKNRYDIVSLMLTLNFLAY